jgi:hypothetical protein
MQLLPVTITLASSRVVDAETAMIEALDRLGRLRFAALLGTGYDPDEYDAAVIAYRHARAAAEDARDSWARSRQESCHYVA